MKLRTQILVFLFLFAFAPLFIAFAINLPLVLDRFERFYHEAHTQNLRADFRDLDQHLASRHEVVSLLSKLPLPGTLLPQTLLENTPETTIEAVSSAQKIYESLPLSQYTSWINRILAEQSDVVLLTFVNQEGLVTNSFMRDPATNNWHHTSDPPVTITAPQPGTQVAGPSRVLISPIIIRKNFEKHDPRLYMTLNLSSPVFEPGKNGYQGHVIITVNVTDFAQHYQNTIWVQSNGQYLFSKDSRSGSQSAFDDYPGLHQLFGRDRLSLWEDSKRQQVIWVPMLRTASGTPLWVGRRVDPSPIANFQTTISWRVAGIMLILVGIIYYLARRFAHQIEKYDDELIDGISLMLEENRPIKLSWKGPVEIEELADKLCKLSEVHAKNTERALHHAKELEASNRYKSQFLANVSHELRTPLNSILLLSKLIKEEPDCSKEQHDKAAVIHAAGKDLKSLIDNILDLSRIEAGKTTFSVQHIDLRELLDELIYLMQPQFEAKQLSLELTIEDNLPGSIFTDAEKVRQILKNFLSNALKFTESGTVSIKTGSDEGGITFEVIDQGIGIDEDKQAHIFEAFHQADGSINRRHGGTGLGLTISHQLAHMMGGSVSLSSTPGEGSVFRLHLPLEFDTSSIDDSLIHIDTEQHEPEIAPSQPLPVKPAEAVNNKASNNHVLVVDDDIKTLLSITPLLESWGYKVSGAGDGEEALETLESEKDIDLILMDIHMPVKDGPSTIGQIIKNPDIANIPIITMSCNDDSIDRIDGTMRHVCKPLDSQLLKNTLAELL